MKSSLITTLIIIFLYTSSYASEKKNPQPLNQTTNTPDANQGVKNIQLIGHAHIDLAYRWRWNETMDRVIPETFRGVLRMMDTVKGLTFAQSQSAIYEVIKKNDPFLFREIQKRIADSTWSVVASQWCEPDEMLPCGESFIRQFVLANEFNQKYLIQKPVNIVWAPDAFSGHAATLPKIYKGCGIDYYVFMRAMPQDKRIFWWESTDGSKILAYNTPYKYNSDLAFNPLIKSVNEWTKISGYADAMVLYGQGDHGGGPREADMEDLKKLRTLPGVPPISFITPEKYFARLKSSAEKFPSYEGEMGVKLPTSEELTLLNKSTSDPKELHTRITHAYGSWRGTYTSHISTKKLNRDAENMLITAETFATIGSGLQGKPFHPRIDFREAWKTLLRNQFHDVLAGTIVGDAARDADEDLKGVVKEGKRLLNFGLETIGSRINTSNTENPLIIYNPLSWIRSGIVSANLRFIRPIEKFSITDSEGNQIPFQVDCVKENHQNIDISMWAGDIPAVGYKVFSVHPDSVVESPKGIALSAYSAENKYFRITWDDDGVTSIFDKTLSKEVLSGKGNTLQLLEEEPSSSWGIFLTGKKIPITRLKGAEMIENGPVRLVVQWRDVTEESLFVRKMILEKESPEVKFSILTDWHDHDKLLKVAFPVKVKQGKGSYEIPYGNIERSLSDLDNPAQNWVDLSNGTWGVSLLNNGRYGFSINEGMIQMSVIRGPRDMDPRMDQGIQEVNYALVAHKGSWKEAEIVNRAYEFNRPLIALQEGRHVAEISGWTRNISLPIEHSFYSTDQKNVIISAIKVLQGDWSPASIVIRLFETNGKESMVKVKLPFKPTSIMEANHIEIPLVQQPKIDIGDGEFSFRIGKDQIRTFIVNGFSGKE